MASRARPESPLRRHRALGAVASRHLRQGLRRAGCLAPRCTPQELRACSRPHACAGIAADGLAKQCSTTRRSLFDQIA